MSQPQITEIAHHLAATLPSEGTKEQTVQAWRSALRHARQTDSIGPITEQLRRDAAGNVITEHYCDRLESP
jgi:hypothetical protein